MNIELAFNEFILNKIDAEREVSLANHSTFKIGGNCALAVFPKSKNELKKALVTLKKYCIKHRVIGRGSNILFSDRGYDGALVFTNKMSKIRREPDGTVYAEAGATLKSVANFAYKNALSGFEFAHGIPGSCGGGVYMNAGAYGGEISSVIKYSDYYNSNTGELGRLEHAEHNFAYRHSVYADRKELIILGACFELIDADGDAIKAVMDENALKRKQKQPLEYPNAGSTFKRPPNAFAAQMIDECGLKGLSVGGAPVSDKHAGFIVNKSGAPAEDVLALISDVRNKVAEKYGVELEAEIEYVE